MKYFLLSLLILFFLSAGFLTCVSNVQAQSVDCSDSGFWGSGVVPCGRNCDNTDTTDKNETDPCTLCHLIVGFDDLINYGFKILVFVALVCLVIAGIMYILSGGSEEMIKTAKTFIKQVLYGFGFVLAACLLIFIVMNYFAVKSDLGIEKESWYEFTCSTESVTGTGSPSSSTENYVCNQVDVNGNGTIEAGEGACNYVTSGGTMTYDECRSSCAVSSHDKCGVGDIGSCQETTGSCPQTMYETTDTDNECSSEQKCCASIIKCGSNNLGYCIPGTSCGSFTQLNDNGMCPADYVCCTSQ